MTAPGSPLRVVRAVAFAVVCVTLAALGHALAAELLAGSGAVAGGSAGAVGASGVAAHGVSVPVLLTAFVVTACAAWLAGGRRRGVLSIGAGLLTVQALLHLLFAGALVPGLGDAGHVSHAGSGSSGSGAGTGMGAGGMGMGLGTGPGTDPEMAPGGSSGPLGMVAVPLSALARLLDVAPVMVAAHLLGAAVCALWLARGEAALFRLVEAFGALAFTPLRLLLTAGRLPAAPRLIRPGPRAARVRRFRGVVLAHTLSRRGPPACRTARATAPGAVARTA
ncbi:hypothetical protein AB0O07_12505 [Streptomyces sp. NPDC093085]|uniref:hypothetical protein n=1 Tax=Streptomyces sp. NPDC093085 TaxID=3155068 RepID=UPI00343B8A4E